MRGKNIENIQWKEEVEEADRGMNNHTKNSSPERSEDWEKLKQHYQSQSRLNTPENKCILGNHSYNRNSITRNISNVLQQMDGCQLYLNLLRNNFSYIRSVIFP